jgi:hypothetical protein
MARRTSYEAPHYALFSNLLSLPLSSGPIFSSALCIKMSSFQYVLYLQEQIKITGMLHLVNREGVPAQSFVY